MNVHFYKRLLTAYAFFMLFGQNGDARNLVDVKPRLTDELMDKSKIWKLTEIGEPTQCRSLRLMDNLRSSKVYNAKCVILFHAIIGKSCSN